MYPLEEHEIVFLQRINRTLDVCLVPAPNFSCSRSDGPVIRIAGAIGITMRLQLLKLEEETQLQKRQWYKIARIIVLYKEWHILENVGPANVHVRLLHVAPIIALCGTGGRPPLLTVIALLFEAKA